MFARSGARLQDGADVAGDHTADSPVSFRLGALTPAVTARTPQRTDSSRNQVARNGLARYYLLLADELRSVNLAPHEARFCCEHVGPDAAQRSPADVIVSLLDAVRHPTLAQERGVDGPALRRKIVNWTPGQRYAVVDAIERWWCLPPHRRDVDTTLADVGLLQPDPPDESP